MLKFKQIELERDFAIFQNYILAKMKKKMIYILIYKTKNIFGIINLYYCFIDSYVNKIVELKFNPVYNKGNRSRKFSYFEKSE